MNKVLIFARDMIPYCSSPGASIRMLTLSNFLKDKGLDITLVSAKGNRVSYFGLKKMVDNIDPIYIDDYIQKRHSRAFSTKAQYQSKLSIFKRIRSQLKIFLKKVVYGISIPDIGIFSVPKFIYKIIFLIKTLKIDTLIVSSPPHSSQFIALALKIIFKKKIFIIVDYRDGWNTFELFKEKNFLRRFISEFFEKKNLEYADFFIYQSQTVFNEIINQYSINIEDLKNKSQLVRNGYTSLKTYKNSEILFGESIINKQRFSLGYFGGISFEPNSYRNPLAFLMELDDLGYKFDLLCFGQVMHQDDCPKFNNISIKFYGTVPMDHAKALMRSCDALLSFHADENGSEVIPGKFYEYVDSERPIISIGPKDMECGKLISQYNFGLHLSYKEIIKNKNKLDIFFSGAEFKCIKKNIRENKEVFSRNHQYSILLKRLKSIEAVNS